MTTTISTSTLLQQAAQSILSGATKSTLDVNSLISALVTAKTAGQAAAISNAQAADNTTLSAIGTMKSSLSALQSALAGLSDGSAFTALTATMSGTGITANTTTGAVAGSYSINVQQIATANQISSKAYASNATLGTGTVTVGAGTGSMSITLTSSNNTLSGLASAINSASNNPGVTASVITATDGQHLVLTSTKTGAANTVTISGGAGVDTGLQTASFTQVTAAQDAKLTISGSAVTSASNTVTGALSGVTLSLTSAAVGTTQTLSVATSNSAIQQTISNFVTAYNAWIATVQSLSSYNSSTSTAAPLLGDAMLNSAVNGIASIVAKGVTTGGTTYSLAQIGLDLQNNGTIVLNSATLSSALATSPGSVQALFNGTNGIGAQLNTFVNSFTASTIGSIDKRSAAINQDLTSLATQQTNLTAYQSTLTSQYTAQFTALNNLMTQMQNSTSYLNQLFGGNGSAGTLNKA